jgi:metal-responsive CopG/Arc/MetJ family transcriptional regulator
MTTTTELPSMQNMQRMRTVTLRLPVDLLEALNKATAAAGRPSASDMMRVILRHYLITNPTLLPKTDFPTR